MVAVDASVTGGITLARDGEHHPLAHAGRDSMLIVRRTAGACQGLRPQGLAAAGRLPG